MLPQSANTLKLSTKKIKLNNEKGQLRYTEKLDEHEGKIWNPRSFFRYLKRRACQN